MKRSLLLAVVAVLAVLALFLWKRDDARTDHAAEPANSAAVTPGTRAVDLAQPSSTSRDTARTGITEVVTPPLPPTPTTTTTAAGSTWTGVRVRVTAVEDGRPLSGIRVRAFPRAGLDDSWTEIDGSHGRLGQSPSTDADGFAELELEPGRIWLVNVGNEDESTSSDTVTVEPALAADEIRELAVSIKTRAELVLHGRVIDRENQSPIVGAGIALLMRDGSSATSSLTDSDGRFRLEGSTWRTSVHTLTAAGYPVVSVVAIAGHATPEDALVIELSRAAALRIRLLDADGAPIAGARAVASTAKYRLAFPYGQSSFTEGMSGDHLWNADTDADGTARLEGLAPRAPLNAMARQDKKTVWRTPVPIVLEPGEVRDVEWRVGGGPELRGIVLELDGRPVLGLDIALEFAQVARPTYFARNGSKGRRTTKTDAAGRFTFTGLAPGGWLVGPAPNRKSGARAIDAGAPAAADAPAAFAQHVVITEGELPPEVEIRVQRGLTIQGRVFDPKGRPTDFAALHVRSIESGAFSFESSRDPSGNFVVGPLLAGEYEIRASSLGEAVDSLPVRARAGDRGLELHLRAGGSLHGIVVDLETGEPCSAMLTCAAENAADAGYLVQSSGADGTFAVDGLVPGTYTLTAATTSGRVGILAGIPVVAGSKSEGLRIELRAGARIRVRFDGPSAVAGIEVLSRGAVVFGDGLEKGTQRELVVPAGELVVRMSLHEQRRDFDLPLTLEVGETRDLVFDGAWK